MTLLYAPLAGIDKRRAAVPEPHGCRTDVGDAERFLRKQAAARVKLATTGLCDSAVIREPMAAARIVGRLGCTAGCRDVERRLVSAWDWWTAIAPVVTRVPELGR